MSPATATQDPCQNQAIAPEYILFTAAYDTSDIALPISLNTRLGLISTPLTQWQAGPWTNPKDWTLVATDETAKIYNGMFIATPWPIICTTYRSHILNPPPTYTWVEGMTIHVARVGTWDGTWPEDPPDWVDDVSDPETPVEPVEAFHWDTREIGQTYPYLFAVWLEGWDIYDTPTGQSKANWTYMRFDTYPDEQAED